MCNLNSGNKTSTCLPKISGILDALYKNKTIDKKNNIKILYYKAKSFC